MNLEEILEIAKSVYGEDNCWSHVDHNVGKHICIYYPKITITNSKNDQHVIKGLVVRLVFWSLANGDLCLDNSVDGTRVIQSHAEYNSTYLHSHLPGGYVGEGFQSFCLGTNQLNSFLAMNRSTAITPTMAEWFFALLNRYVSYESLEGGPYRNMTNIKGQSNKEVATNTFAKVISYLNLAGLPRPPMNFAAKTVTLNVSEEYLDDVINRIFKTRQFYRYMRATNIPLAQLLNAPDSEAPIDKGIKTLGGKKFNLLIKTDEKTKQQRSVNSKLKEKLRIYINTIYCKRLFEYFSRTPYFTGDRIC